MATDRSKGASVGLPWNEEPFAEEVARSIDGDTLLFRVIAPIARKQEWSEPMRFLFQRRDDGTYELVFRHA